MSDANTPGGSGKDPSNWKIPDRVDNPTAEVGVPDDYHSEAEYSDAPGTFRPTGKKKGMSRRSKVVTAGVITTLVGGGLYGLSALGNNNSQSTSNNDRRCVDDNNVVVDDSQCSNGGGGHYYYGGFGGFFPGSVVSGGSSTRPTNNSTISRGGIGSGSDTSNATSSAGS